MPRGKPIKVKDPTGREWTVPELAALTGCTYQSIHLRLKNHPGDWEAISAPRDTRAVRTAMGNRLTGDYHLSPEEHRAMYRRWTNMMSRCHNPQNKRYADYGGRGIRVYEEWRTYPQGFEAFLRHVGTPPFDGAQLDRIDNDGGYEPGNLRWVTNIQNCNNRRPRRDTRWLPSPVGDGTYVGVREAARLAGLPYSTVYNRLDRGYFKAEDLYRPVRKKVQRGR